MVTEKALQDLCDSIQVDIHHPKLTVRNDFGIIGLNLDLSHYLIELPKNMFEDFRDLRFLTISNYEHDKLPNALFSGMENLTHLRIAKSKITSLPNDLLMGLKHLDMFELLATETRTLPPHLFQETPEITIINMNGNKLNQLPIRILESLKELNKLSLRSNKLKSISLDLFITNKKLYEIVLTDNLLEEVDANLYQDLPNLVWLDLRNNPGLPSLLNEQFSNSPDEYWLDASIKYRYTLCKSSQQVIDTLTFLKQELLPYKFTEVSSRRFIQQFLDLDPIEEEKTWAYLRII